MSNPVQTISSLLTLLNAAIATTSNVEKYRITVADAVAAGRDISDAELAKAAGDLDAAIDAAEKA
jgi:hypothetical protein